MRHSCHSSIPWVYQHAGAYSLVFLDTENKNEQEGRLIRIDQRAYDIFVPHGAARSHYTTRCGPLREGNTMRVLINAVPLYGKGAGVRTYTAELLKALSASNADMEWGVLLRDADFDRLGLAVDPRFRHIRFMGPAAPPHLPGARFLWRNAIDQVVMPLAGHRYDVTHYLDTYGPLLPLGPSPFALTVHDLFPITNPEYFSPWIARYLAFLMRAIPRASSLMAISAETARALTAVFGIPPERIRIIQNGVDARFHPASATERLYVARKYAIEGPYLIAVGAVERRKNLARAIRAFARARRDAEFAHRLLIAGQAWVGVCRDRGG